MNVSDIGCSLSPSWNKDTMNRMLEKLGREETVKRFAWLHSTTEEVVDNLIT